MLSHLDARRGARPLLDLGATSTRAEELGSASTRAEEVQFLNRAPTPRYPFKPPAVVFKTEILHPNVKTDTGEICPDTLFANWSPTLNIRTTLTTLHELLSKPAVEHPLETDLAVLYGEDRKKYDAKVAAHVKALKKK